MENILIWITTFFLIGVIFTPYYIKFKNEDKINELIRQKKIKAIFNSNVREIKEKSVLIEVDNKIHEIPNNYVFIFAGGMPPFAMLKGMGITFGSV